MYDAIVIGAGPAGLQAALTLGRMHRPVLLLDSGEYRNGTVQHMHNMIGADGKAPADLRAQARVELAAYADVTVRDVAVLNPENFSAWTSTRISRVSGSAFWRWDRTSSMRVWKVDGRSASPATSTRPE